MTNHSQVTFNAHEDGDIEVFVNNKCVGIIQSKTNGNGHAFMFVSYIRHVALNNGFTHHTIDDIKRLITLRVHACDELNDGDCIQVWDDEFIVRVHGVYASVVFVRREHAGSFSPKFKAHVTINDNIFTVDRIITPAGNVALEEAQRIIEAQLRGNEKKSKGWISVIVWGIITGLLWLFVWAITHS